jgi:paraquat-inducible protein A
MEGHSANSAPDSKIWLECPRCRADCLDRDLAPGQHLRCGRCDAEVKSSTGGPRSILAAWAFSTAGLLAMIPANTTPILKFDVIGNFQENHIFTGVEGLWNQGFEPIAVLVFFSAIAAPAIYLLSVWYVSALCTLRLHWPGLRFFFAVARHLEAWNLMPVFAIACVVSVVKLRTLGDVSWEQGAIWVGVLSLFTLLTIQFFNRRHVQIVLEEKS